MIISNGSGEIQSFDLDVSIDDLTDIILRDIGDDYIVLTGLGGNETALAGPLHARLDARRLVYDVYDDLEYGATGAKRVDFLLSDLIWRVRCEKFVVLDAGMRPRYPDALHLNNASHLKRIAAVEHADPRSTVYIGSIDERVDFDWLDRVARTRRVTVHGRIHGNSTSTEQQFNKLLKHNSNVVYAGEYDNDDLWEILGRYSVGLVPYRTDHPMTRNINPDKAYHYLNAGLEVVATPIPQMDRLARFITLTSPEAEPDDAFASALTERPSRVWDANAYSWDRRWQELVDYVVPDQHA